MRDFLLDRHADTGHATFGRLEDDESREICCTLERPWLGNQHDVSCVPAGVYLCKRRFSPKHQFEVFELQDVPHRANIEIHPGNKVFDSLGCILVGNRHGMIDGEYGVLESRAAFQRFMDSLRGQDVFRLTIISALESAA